MARPLRPAFLGAVYHLTARGNEGSAGTRSGVGLSSCFISRIVIPADLTAGEIVPVNLYVVT